MRPPQLLLCLTWFVVFHACVPGWAERPETITVKKVPAVSASFDEKPERRVSSFADLQELARQTAASSYVPEPPLIPVLANMNYDQYREIQFRHDQGVWNDSRHPFWVEFFHRGFVQQDRVDVYQLDRRSRTGLATEVKYHPSQFNFGGVAADLRIPPSVGYAGLKIAGRFQRGGDPQELLTFLGSSYFRSRSSDTVYGTSARGLAVNIGMNQDEEFPDFRAFWVQEPAPGDQTVCALALLDSPSLSGAYEFHFDPGEKVSQLDVRASLYFRQTPDKLALAPLTSMWIWGDGLKGPEKDERPSVHDSDGLLIHYNDGWQWRGLARLPYPSVTSTKIDEVKGFGLLQRDRNFEHYLDSNARYHERPSVWVRPNESWGPGRIELLEIPGAHEGIDNIGAYFVSDSPVVASEPMMLNYSVFFFSDESALRSAVVPITENGTSMLTCREFDVVRDEKQITLKVNFGLSDAHDGEDAGVATATSQKTNTVADQELVESVQLIRGKKLDQRVTQTLQGCLVELVFEPTEDAPIEIELLLNDSSGRPASETFRYLCPHETPTFVYPAVYTRQE
ncbi:glucan biosynthesis protein [Aporhodopirellula aestuarii]|uniref:Glucan biosynthesis protein n=1 Tax=Aporhodopirellula aestuarii TaxID=2950107 RepID=A0ABT0U652_9BACT|nr:glucan biosynthesis protein [Aporhodopirellula aestuarii]MCM2372412.1 glucan biosynthesis protein [Aporhodopirellula aestuarii]